MELKDKTVLITGRWSKAAVHSLAREIARKGAHVVLVNKAADTLESVTREIRNDGKKAVAIQADVRREPELTRMIQQTLAAFGRIDILVHHLGRFHSLPPRSPAGGVTAAQGQFRYQQAVMPTLLRQQSGTILNVGTVRRPSAPTESISILMTRVKGACLQVKTLGGNWAMGDPTLRDRLGEAMGLAGYPCLQVQHQARAIPRAPKPDGMTGFLVALISEASGGSPCSPRRQKE